MLKQLSCRMEKVLAILLAVLFVVSLTTVVASSRGGLGEYGWGWNYGSPYGSSYYPNYPSYPSYPNYPNCTNTHYYSLYITKLLHDSSKFMSRFSYMSIKMTNYTLQIY